MRKNSQCISDLFIRRFTKPTNFADCVGDELPLGWEEAYDNVIGRYYINHINRKWDNICINDYEI